MSKGPGRIEREVAAILKAEPDNAFTVEDLCLRIYDDVEKKHQVAVLRAAANVCRKDDTFARFKWSKVVAYYTVASVLSYAMARLKTDNITGRLGWEQDEDQLRAMLAPGGQDHHEVVPGGTWAEHVRFALEERDAIRAGDTKRLARIRAKQEAGKQKALQRIFGRIKPP